MHLVSQIAYRQTATEKKDIRIEFWMQQELEMHPLQRTSAPFSATQPRGPSLENGIKIELMPKSMVYVLNSLIAVSAPCRLLWFLCRLLLNWVFNNTSAFFKLACATIKSLLGRRKHHSLNAPPIAKSSNKAQDPQVICIRLKVPFLAAAADRRIMHFAQVQGLSIVVALIQNRVYAL